MSIIASSTIILPLNMEPAPLEALIGADQDVAPRINRLAGAIPR